MTLMLHKGGVEIDYAALREVETPPATPTHVPIPHFRVLDLVKTTLGMYSHEVTAEHLAVAEDGMRFFGLLSLRSPYTGYEDTLIVRNANDKAFPVGVGFGSRCFCCDNLAFIAQHVVTRRHTANLKSHLPGLIGEMIEPLTEQRETQHRKILTYQKTELTDTLADHAIMSMFREGVLNIQRVPEVLREYDEPSFEEFRDGPRNAWRLFNAATFVLTGRVAENPNVTRKLHQIVDGICEHVA